MEDFNRKKHWENIYQTKGQQDVSWYQAKPNTSLSFIESFDLPLNARIIDIGGGDGFLVDCLLEKGYVNIAVLDISSAAIEKAKARLGEKASLVKWIVADITEFEPDEKYDIWHDRAVFHFLVDDVDIEKYRAVAGRSTHPNGRLVIGTFSESGPKKCSGIEIKQYSETTLNQVFKTYFEIESILFEDHKTPFDTFQNFVFCTFRKK